MAATRLMWALGFDTDPVFPVIVECQDCPANPWTGEGPRQARRFDAEYEPHYVGTVITSTKDPDQGWAFGELEKAIDSLPSGALRMRQRMHFDALTLLAVFIQHGDRKRSQQRLVCRGNLDVEGGDLRDLPGARHDTAGMGVLFESPSVRACLGDTVVTLQDVGATFGGAGRFTGRAAEDPSQVLGRQGCLRDAAARLSRRFAGVPRQHQCIRLGGRRRGREPPDQRGRPQLPGHTVGAAHARAHPRDFRDGPDRAGWAKCLSGRTGSTGRIPASTPGSRFSRTRSARSSSVTAERELWRMRAFAALAWGFAGSRLEGRCARGRRSKGPAAAVLLGRAA